MYAYPRCKITLDTVRAKPLLPNFLSVPYHFEEITYQMRFDTFRKEDCEINETKYTYTVFICRGRPT